MVPLVPNLRDYGMTPECGFLPSEAPTAILQDPYYEKWEAIVANFPVTVADHHIRAAVDEMPVLTTAHLRTCAEWRRAYVLLAFMSHAYIWGGVTPSEVCFKAQPWIYT